MQGLFSIRRYPESLFYGHIVLEKILKALVVQNTEKESPIMSKNKVKTIVKQYADKLRAADYPFSAVYLFGSHANGNAHQWSDIDVAVVSNRLKRNWWNNEMKLSKLSLGIDYRLEPHGFTPEDFQDECDPMVQEIKKTGIRIV